MGNQWGDIYLCVPQPKCWGRVPPSPYNRRPWPVHLVSAVPSYAAVRSPHRHPVLTTDTSHVVQTGVSTWHQLLYPTTADDASRLVFDVVEKKTKRNHSSSPSCRRRKKLLQVDVKTAASSLTRKCNKKRSYRRVTARCVLSVAILPITTQQCRNYLYDKF